MNTSKAHSAPTVTQSIRSFLAARKAHHNGPDLLERYLRFPEMETQVNVAQGAGERDGTVFTDGIDKWWNIRIPKNADSEPQWHDYRMTWPLDLHAEAIGCTGWDWECKRSRWVGFDFDSITGHAAGVGIGDDELIRVREAACALPWVEVRRSTGGNGLHLYVLFNDDGVETANHTEHAALARAILGLMSIETGFDFTRHVDACGGNMWIWARKMTAENNGFALVKAAEAPLLAIPQWSAPERSEHVGNDLNEQHRADIAAMREAGFIAAWNGKQLDCHTKGFEALRRPGYRSTSPASEPKTPNASATPTYDGGWVINRFGTPPTAEADGWTANAGGCAMFRLLPPLDDMEVQGRPDPKPKPKLNIISADDIMTHNQEPRPSVVHGLIQSGDVVNCVAPPKMHKSFFGAQLALSVAHALPFLGYPTVQGNVLILDLELKRDTMARRLRDVSRAMGIDKVHNLDIAVMRGTLANLATIRDVLVSDPGLYNLVVLDPLFKTLHDYDENSNSDMARVYSMLDEMAEKHGCALVVIHHTSKGAQHAKSVTDMGAGAGAQSRSADCHIVLRQHEDPDTVVMQAVVRSQKPIEPQCLVFDYPLWTPAPDKSVNTLAVAGKRSKPTMEDFLKLVPDKPIARNLLLDDARHDLSATKEAVKALYDGAVSQGLIEILERKKQNQPFMVRRTAAKAAA